MRRFPPRRSAIVLGAVLALILVGLGSLPGMAQDLSPSESAIIGQFAADAMRNADSATRSGSDLQKARYLFTKLCNRLSAHGERVNSTRMSRIGNAVANLDGSRLSCSNLTNITMALFHGAGIRSERTFEMVGDKNSWSASLTLDPNRNHEVPCLIFDGKVYTFDAWQYAVHNTSPALTFTGGGSSDWNGLPLDKWGARMTRQGYVRFSSNAQDEAAGIDQTRWHKTANEAGAEAVAARRKVARTQPTNTTTSGATSSTVRASGKGQWVLVEIEGKDENQAPTTCKATFSDNGFEADVEYTLVYETVQHIKFHATAHWPTPPGVLTPGQTLQIRGTGDHASLKLPGSTGIRAESSSYTVPAGTPGGRIQLIYDGTTTAGKGKLCWNVRDYRYKWVGAGDPAPDPAAAARNVVSAPK